MLEIQDGERILTISSAVWTLYRIVIDRQTDRQTDRRTDIFRQQMPRLFAALKHSIVLVKIRTQRI